MRMRSEVFFISKSAEAFRVMRAGKRTIPL